MIRLDRVTKWYPTIFGRKVVLRDVTLNIPSGANVGILGRNGAGKSTLLRLIGGIDSADEGSVRVTGSVSWPVGLSGGYQGSMTGRENTRFVGRVHGVAGRDLNRLCDFVRDFSELGRDFDLPVKTYSNGMRARLGFAASMAFDFDYYIFDEITAVGDEAFRRKSEAALKAKQGRGNWLMASHAILSLVKEVDVALLVAGGTVHYFQDPKAALSAYQALIAPSAPSLPAA